MTSTRIIVKNLPPYLSQDAFAKHFVSFASPTDSRLQSSKSGRSRRFGFVGFSSSADAEKAVEHWHNTYIGSTKITAELARSVEEELATNYKKKRPAEDATTTAKSSVNAKKLKSMIEPIEKDSKLGEFLRLNQPRSKTKTFLNDDGEFTQQAALRDDPGVIHESVADLEYDTLPAPITETYEVIDHEPTNQATVKAVERIATSVPDDADDEEWLRNRTSRTLDLVEPDTESLTAAPTTTQVKPVPTSVKLKPAPIPALIPPKTPAQIEDELNAAKAAEKVSAIDAIRETSRLFLRNLAFTVDETALQDLFANYGNLEEVHLPLSADGKHKGTAYILFQHAPAAVSAYTELDGKQFQGRLLHILPGKGKITIEKPLAPGQTLNIGQKRKEERRKEASKNRFNWNSLFLNQNAVLENTAKKFGIEKSELLDPSQSNAAVTMALAESSALGTIKKFFESHGVNLQSFASNKQKDDSIILFKNLPSHANEDEIRKLVEGADGIIGRIVMPEIGGLAIVEVTDANQGKSVFSKLAYRKFGDGVLYLEKGPVNTFTSVALLDSAVPNKSTVNVEDQEDEAESERATIFVKNLNFETRAPALTRIFESLKGYRSATVKTKPNPKDLSAASRLSMGFGFVDFATEADAKLAIKAMQGFTLDDHALELKLSNGRSTDTKPVQDLGKGSTKVLVKNLPFETTKADVQRLFSTYGSIKSLRLPKKYNSHLRGFAFLEFVSKREAKNAISALTGTHLLGRRLVLEYAQTDATGDEGIEQLVEKTRLKRSAIESVEKGRRKTGKINLDGTEADGLE